MQDSKPSFLTKCSLWLYWPLRWIFIKVRYRKLATVDAAMNTDIIQTGLFCNNCGHKISFYSACINMCQVCAEECDDLNTDKRGLSLRAKTVLLFFLVSVLLVPLSAFLGVRAWWSGRVPDEDSLREWVASSSGVPQYYRLNSLNKSLLRKKSGEFVISFEAKFVLQESLYETKEISDYRPEYSSALGGIALFWQDPKAKEIDSTLGAEAVIGKSSSVVAVIKSKIGESAVYRGGVGVVVDGLGWRYVQIDAKASDLGNGSTAAQVVKAANNRRSSVLFLDRPADAAALEAIVAQAKRVCVKMEEARMTYYNVRAERMRQAVNNFFSDFPQQAVFVKDGGGQSYNLEVTAADRSAQSFAFILYNSTDYRIIRKFSGKVDCNPDTQGIILYTGSTKKDGMSRSDDPILGKDAAMSATATWDGRILTWTWADASGIMLFRRLSADVPKRAIDTQKKLIEKILSEIAPKKQLRGSIKAARSDGAAEDVLYAFDAPQNDGLDLSGRLFSVRERWVREFCGELLMDPHRAGQVVLHLEAFHTSAIQTAPSHSIFNKSDLDIVMIYNGRTFSSGNGIGQTTDFIATLSSASDSYIAGVQRIWENMDYEQAARMNQPPEIPGGYAWTGLAWIRLPVNSGKIEESRGAFGITKKYTLVFRGKEEPPHVSRSAVKIAWRSTSEILPSAPLRLPTMEMALLRNYGEKRELPMNMLKRRAGETDDRHLIVGSKLSTSAKMEKWGAKLYVMSFEKPLPHGRYAIIIDGEPGSKLFYEIVIEK